MPAAQDERILTSLKRVSSALQAADVPFAVAGGLATWARGGPPTEKDIDVAIRPEDEGRARRALQAVGMRPEVPPEDWLVKAFDGDILIDLIFRPAGLVIDDAFLERCDVLDVHAVRMRVMPVDDVLSSKLLALTEHHLDYGPPLEIARSLREQVDWADVYRRTRISAFARAFFTLLDELDIVEGFGRREDVPVGQPTGTSTDLDIDGVRGLT